MDDFWAWLAVVALCVLSVCLVLVCWVMMVDVRETPGYPRMDILDDPDVPEHVKEMFRENNEKKDA